MIFLESLDRKGYGGRNSRGQHQVKGKEARKGGERWKEGENSHAKKKETEPESLARRV